MGVGGGHRVPAGGFKGAQTIQLSHRCMFAECVGSILLLSLPPRSVFLQPTLPPPMRARAR